MVTFYNAKEEKFFLKIQNPGSIGIDNFVLTLKSGELPCGSAGSAYRYSPILLKSSKGIGNTSDPILAIV